MFLQKWEVISDQFENLYMFSFWGNGENGRRGGGFPCTHFTLSQNVNILVKTKNAPKVLEHKININYFCDMGVPTKGGGVSQSVNCSHVFPFLVLTASLNSTNRWKMVTLFIFDL